MEHEASYNYACTYCPYTHPQPIALVRNFSKNVKKLFFLKVVILHVKLKGMEQRAPCKHIFYPYTQPLPLGLD